MPEAASIPGCFMFDCVMNCRSWMSGFVRHFSPTDADSSFNAFIDEAMPKPWYQTLLFRLLLIAIAVYLGLGLMGTNYQRDQIFAYAPDSFPRSSIRAWAANSPFTLGDLCGVMLFDMDDETRRAVRNEDIGFLQTKFSRSHNKKARYQLWSSLPYPANEFSEGAPAPVACARGLGQPTLMQVLQTMKGGKGFYSDGRSGMSLFLSADADIIALIYYN